MKNRLVIMFEKTYPQNILRGCAELNKSALSDLNDFFNRVIKTQSIDDNVIENALRVLRIMPKDKKEFREINQNLFVETEEVLSLYTVHTPVRQMSYPACPPDLIVFFLVIELVIFPSVSFVSIAIHPAPHYPAA